MRKVLTAVTEAEADEGVCLISLRATYDTMLKITRYPIDQKKLAADIAECETSLKNYWEIITFKYQIPFYVDKPMGIDNISNYIYVEM